LNTMQNIQRSIQKKIRVLGIDPGLNITGYGVIAICGSADPEVIEAGTFRMDPKASLGKRVSQIYADLTELIAEVKPDIVAVEQLYAHYKHPRTSILMGHARGVILLAAEQAGLTSIVSQLRRSKKASPATAWLQNDKCNWRSKASANSQKSPNLPMSPTRWQLPSAPAEP